MWRRKDGRHGARFTWDTPTGKRTATTTKATEGEAEAWLLRTRADALDGEPAVSGPQTVAEYLDGWLRDAVEPSKARRTHEKRSWAVRVHINPALGKVKLTDLDARRIQALNAATVREGYSYWTRREIHVTLKTALEQAVRWGVLRRNPAAVVEAPRDLSGPAQDEIRALTDSQARRLFALAGARGSRWRNYYVAAVRTGLRPGEMLGLRWGDLDLEGEPGSLRVRRSLDTHGGAFFGPPKSARSRRTVALHREAKAALLAQRGMLEGEGLPTGDGNLVFPSQTGSPMKSDNLRKRNLKPDLARCGLPGLTLHELRHTFASIMLHEWMVPPAVVSKMMGHASIAFTFDLYGHLIPSAEEDVMRRLNAAHAEREAGAV